MPDRAELRNKLILAACLIGSSSVQALSLGEMRVSSGIGRPFHAAIPFVLGPGEELTPGCVSLAADAPSRNADVPHLGGASVVVESQGSSGRIVLRTRTAVNEPAVRAYLRFACGPKVSLTREWVLLMDAPGSQAPDEPRPSETPAAAEITAPIAAGGERPATGIARSASRPKAPTVAPSPTAAAAPNTDPRLEKSAPAGEARARTRSAKPAAGSFRLSLSRPGDVLPEEPPFAGLKRSESLSDGGTIKRTREQIELLRLQARIALSEDPLAEAERLRERIAALEAGTLKLRGELESLAASRLAAEEKADRLARENRRLSAWLDGLGAVVALLASAALLAWIMRRYRRDAEVREARARNWPPDAQVEASRGAFASLTPAPALPAADPPVAAQAVLPANLRGSGPTPTRTPASEPRPATPATDEPGVETGNDDHVRTVVIAPHTLATSADNPVFPPRAAVLMSTEPPVAQHAIDNASLEVVDFFLPPVTEASTPVPAQGGMPRFPTQRMPTLPPGSGAAPDRDTAKPVAGQAATVPGELAGTSGKMLAGGEEAARAAAYQQEFENRMFPEIATGRVKLADARSIVVLARTYYQEDFDAAKSIGLLEYALTRASDPMRIHLALLEVLRMERRASEYLATAISFRRRYPEGATHWQLIAAYGRLLDPAEPAYVGDPVPGLDLDTPSNWLGSTLDMTKYVLGQKVAASLREVPELTPRAAA